MSYKFPYEWTLKNANFTKDKGKVFSCFACGGGSTMGYKLAGFDVIGMNEIDPKMAAAYIANHKPKYSFIEPIQTFKNRADLPKELYELDILDGSPPCSSFSIAGNREKDWGKAKKFREGQSFQILDDLFYHFIDLAKVLQPKIVIAENVKGLLFGKSISYVREIYKQLDVAGYYCQHFLLDASRMGVPQRRERVFFIALRKDLAGQFLYQKDIFTVLPKLELKFNHIPITYKEIKTEGNDNSFTEHDLLAWNNRIKSDSKYSDVFLRIKNKETNFNSRFIKDEKVCNTITSTSGSKMVSYSEPRKLNNAELIKIGSFPLDYDFSGNNVKYIIGMSVPPVMVAQIASEIYNQWNEVF